MKLSLPFYLTKGFAFILSINLPLAAEQIEIPNAGFEERESFDPFPDGTDKYPQWGLETWRQFNLSANGGPTRIWNPGTPGVDDTSQGVLDVAFNGDAPEGNYVILARSRENDPGRDFEAVVQILPEPFDSTKAYTLNAQVGRLPDADNGGSFNYTPDWFGYAVQFVVGGTNVDGARFAGQVTGGTVLAEDWNTIEVPMNEFVTSTVIYKPNPEHAEFDGQPIQIRLCALETPENREDDSLAGWVAFDDVTLQTGIVFPPDKFIKISQVTHSSEDNSVTLTWNSSEGQSYTVEYSHDLITWDGVLNNDIPGSPGITTTRTLSLNPVTGDKSSLFLRIFRNAP